MKIKNIALGISVCAFVIGFSDLQENMFFWLARPVGAIAFIVALIFVFLEKEYAIMDEQEATKTAAFKNCQPLPTITSSTGSNRETCAPALTTAS